MLKQWFKDESGQALSEYGLLIAIIVVGLIVIVGLFRNKLIDVFSNATTELGKAGCNIDPATGKCKP